LKKNLVDLAKCSENLVRFSLIKGSIVFEKQQLAVSMARKSSTSHKWCGGFVNEDNRIWRTNAC